MDGQLKIEERRGSGKRYREIQEERYIRKLKKEEYLIGIVFYNFIECVYDYV